MSSYAIPDPILAIPDGPRQLDRTNKFGRVCQGAYSFRGTLLYDAYDQSITEKTGSDVLVVGKQTILGRGVDGDQGDSDATRQNYYEINRGSYTLSHTPGWMVVIVGAISGGGYYSHAMGSISNSSAIRFKVGNFTSIRVVDSGGEFYDLTVPSWSQGAGAPHLIWVFYPYDDVTNEYVRLRAYHLNGALAFTATSSASFGGLVDLQMDEIFAGFNATGYGSDGDFVEIQVFSGLPFDTFADMSDLADELAKDIFQIYDDTSRVGPRYFYVPEEAAPSLGIAPIWITNRRRRWPHVPI